MRGKLYPLKNDLGNGRNIPAYAGKTRRSVGSCGGFQEHPRACGENVAVNFRSPASTGTSPRMRGKLVELTMPPLVFRNIPAHVGKTLLLGQETARAAEHPRVCGENDTGFPLPPPSEHPRVCGENDSFDDSGADTGGTSPRMRGKRTTTLVRRVTRGNIPAHAGKTGFAAESDGVWAEHPRACGENGWGFRGHRISRGTSPRMRGKLPRYGEISIHSRNIPAHAGKTNRLQRR